MEYISTPISFVERDNHQIEIIRDIEERITMLDNLIELIVFTPRGTFSADPDFGFEYWDYEYSNVNITQFNNNNTGRENHQEATKVKCQDSIRQSLKDYAPDLQIEDISMVLNAAETDKQGRKKVLSRHQIVIVIKGKINGSITTLDYTKTISFFVEPTAKRVII